MFPLICTPPVSQGNSFGFALKLDVFPEESARFRAITGTGAVTLRRSDILQFTWVSQHLRTSQNPSAALVGPEFFSMVERGDPQTW